MQVLNNLIYHAKEITKENKLVFLLSTVIYTYTFSVICFSLQSVNVYYYGNSLSDTTNIYIS